MENYLLKKLKRDCAQAKDRLERVKNEKNEAFIDGAKHALWLYAWWKDGTQYVGTCGTTLEKAIEDIENEYGLKNKQINN